MSEKKSKKVNENGEPKRSYTRASMLPMEAVLGKPVGHGCGGEELLVPIPLKCSHCSLRLELVDCESEVLYKGCFGEGDFVEVMFTCGNGHTATGRFVEEASGAILCFETDRKGIVEPWHQPDEKAADEEPESDADATSA